MSLERLHFETREDWLAGRQGQYGIGASEGAAALGLSKWCSPVELWQVKTGRRPGKDLSGVEYVQLGIRTEGPMRDLFAALHPEYEVRHFPYDILFQKDRPWMFATLDGELTERSSGEAGMLEIKKYEIQKASDWKEWDGKVPDYYFCQLMHQLCATGYAFAWLFALLLKRDGNGEVRQYYFPRAAYADDMAELLRGEERFMSYVRSDRIPPAPMLL